MKTNAVPPSSVQYYGQQSLTAARYGGLLTGAILIGSGLFAIAAKRLHLNYQPYQLLMKTALVAGTASGLLYLLGRRMVWSAPLPKATDEFRQALNGHTDRDGVFILQRRYGVNEIVEKREEIESHPFYSAFKRAFGLPVAVALVLRWDPSRPVLNFENLHVSTGQLKAFGAELATMPKQSGQVSIELGGARLAKGAMESILKFTSLFDEVGYLHLSGCRFRADEIGQLAETLKRVRTIELSRCALDADAVPHLAALAKVDNLYRLNLSENELGGTSDTIVRSVIEQKRAFDLDLSNTNFNRSEIFKAMKSVEEHRHSVVVRVGRIGDKATTEEAVREFLALRENPNPTIRYRSSHHVHGKPIEYLDPYAVDPLLSDCRQDRFIRLEMNIEEIDFTLFNQILAFKVGQGTQLKPVIRSYPD